MKNNRLIPLAAALATCRVHQRLRRWRISHESRQHGTRGRAAIAITELSVEGSDRGEGYSYLVRLAIQNSGAAPRC
jgi:hypothetical protein